MITGTCLSDSRKENEFFSTCKSSIKTFAVNVQFMRSFETFVQRDKQRKRNKRNACGSSTCGLRSVEGAAGSVQRYAFPDLSGFLVVFGLPFLRRKESVPSPCSTARSSLPELRRSKHQPKERTRSFRSSSTDMPRSTQEQISLLERTQLSTISS